MSEPKSSKPPLWFRILIDRCLPVVARISGAFLAVSLEYRALESRIRFAHAAGYNEERWELRRELSDLYWRLERLRDGDQHAWRDVEYALVWTRSSDALRRIEDDLDARWARART